MNDFNELLNTVREEVNRIEDGGTAYRIQTALLSLKAVEEMGADGEYLIQERLREQVRALHLVEDLDRLNDVAKFIHTLAKLNRMKREETPELKAYLKSKKPYSIRFK